MQTTTEIRVFDFINRPYRNVKERLLADIGTVFAAATNAAASRADAIVAELHARIAGVDVGADVEIEITGVTEADAGVVVGLKWQAATMPHFFPTMDAELSVRPLGGSVTQIDLVGRYVPPFGALGGIADAAVGHRIAEASIHHFISDLAGHLRVES